MQSGIPFKTEMANEMLNLLQECDVNEVGVVDYTDLCMIFKRFTKDSDLLYDLMLSEVDVSAGFDIAYKNVYLSLSRLMPVYTLYYLYIIVLCIYFTILLYSI